MVSGGGGYNVQGEGEQKPTNITLDYICFWRPATAWKWVAYITEDNIWHADDTTDTDDDIVVEAATGSSEGQDVSR